MYIIIALLLSFMTLGVSSNMFYSNIKKYCSRANSEKLKLYQQKYYSKLISKFNGQVFNIVTEDNIKLNSVLIERPGAKRTILMIHGYWQSKEFLYPLVKLFNQDNIFLIDLRAHGLSEGELISWGHTEYKDVVAAIDFLSSKRELKELPLFAIGCSMGSASLLKAMATKSKGSKVQAIVLDSGFDDLKGKVYHTFNKKVKWLKDAFPAVCYAFNKVLNGAVDQFKPYKLIQDIEIPILIIHSKEDKVVPVSCAYNLYENATSSKKNLWIVENSKHIKIFEDYPKEYRQRVLEFFNKSNINSTNKMGEL